MTPSTFAIIVDTDRYAGDFHLELFAYVTGQSDPGCYTGEIARSAASEIRNLGWWQKHTRSSTLNGRSGAVSIVATPDWYIDERGVARWDSPSVRDSRDADLAFNRFLVEKCEEIIATGNYPKELDIRPTEYREIVVDLRKAVHKLAFRAPRAPAYLSVTIEVDEFPTAEVFSEFKKRVGHFIAKRTEIALADRRPAPWTKLLGIRVLEVPLADPMRLAS